MDKVSKELFGLFKQSYLDSYFDVVNKIKCYESLQNRLCDYLYGVLIDSDIYRRYLMLNMTDGIEIDIPKSLKKMGICSIQFIEDGFEVFYDISSLNNKFDFMYTTLSNFVESVEVKNYNVENNFMIHGIDMAIGEFYYDTYLLLGSPNIRFNKNAKVKVSSGPFLILDYSAMNDAWNYNFPNFYYLDTYKNTILVYLTSFYEFFNSRNGLVLLRKSSRILYYAAVSRKMYVFSILSLLERTDNLGTFNLLFGSKLKELGLSKVEWLNLKGTLKKLSLKGINICFLDSLPK